jgi:hypothetical protein
MGNTMRYIPNEDDDGIPPELLTGEMDDDDISELFDSDYGDSAVEDTGK